MSIGSAILLVLAGCTQAPTAPVPVAQSADLVARPLPEPSRPPACAGPSGPYLIEGDVTWADGSPAAGVAVGFAEGSPAGLVEIARTDATGAYHATLDHAGYVGVLDELAARGPACVRAPVATGSAREGFVLGHGCPVRVQVRTTRGVPVAGAHARWEAREDGVTFRGVGAGLSDGDGFLSLDDLPCGEVAVQIDRAGLAQARTDVGVPAGLRAPCLAGDVDSVRACFHTRPAAEPPQVAVEMGPAVALRGRVTDPGGSPIAGATASVLLIGDTVTDEDGRWELWVPPSSLRDKRFLAIRSPAHADATVEVFGPDDTGAEVATAAPGGTLAWQKDVTLTPTRRVAARCAGFDHDGCGSMMLTCGVEGDRPIRECTDGDPVACECPTDPGRASVMSGGGVRVYVEREATSVWLDFRAVGGGVRGVSGAPGCVVRLDRPAAQRADPLAASESRAVPCEADGSFFVEHVAPGPWELRVLGRGGLAGGGPARRVDVGDAVVDLGRLDAGDDAPAVAGD